MKRITQVVALGILVLCSVASVVATSTGRKATWKDFEGTWIGCDPGTGESFHRLVLNEDKTGTLVVLLSEEVAWLYKVSVLSWDENRHINLKFVPFTGTDDKPYEMESVEGFRMTLREKGVKKPNRPREVQLIRESEMKQNTARAEKLAEKMK